MTALTPTIVAKIVKLIPRLASDHDGEVVATARALMRTLRTAGHDLHDVVATLQGPVREVVVYRDRPAPAKKPKKRKDNPDIDWSDENCLDEVLRDGPRLLDSGRLGGMQVNFVRDMIAQARLLGPAFRMSVKQLAWFRSLVAEKLRGAE